MSQQTQLEYWTATPQRVEPYEEPNPVMPAWTGRFARFSGRLQLIVGSVGVGLWLMAEAVACLRHGPLELINLFFRLVRS